MRASDWWDCQKVRVNDIHTDGIRTRRVWTRHSPPPVIASVLVWRLAVVESRNAIANDAAVGDADYAGGIVVIVHSTSIGG